MGTADNLPAREMKPANFLLAVDRDVVFGVGLTVGTATADLVGIAVDRIFQLIFPRVGWNLGDDWGNPFGLLGCITRSVTNASKVSGIPFMRIWYIWMLFFSPFSWVLVALIFASV